MRKLLFVCQSLGNGGAERVISVLTRHFDNSKYKLYVLPMNISRNKYTFAKNITILNARKKTQKGMVGKIQRIRYIRHAIRENEIDIIIAFSHYNVMFSVIASFGLNVRIIGSERNDPAQIGKRKFTNSMRNILYQKIDALVCQTNDAKMYFPLNIQKKTVVILNPISEEIPEPYMGEKEKKVISFCRLDEQKNLPMMINAFGLFRDEYNEYILEIYGDGPERKYLSSLIKEKKLDNNVFLNPFCDNIFEIANRAKMFLLSSNYEGLSNSMLEAMALGLPVVVTDCPCGGARMVIRDGENGMLVPVGDYVAMFKSMRRIMQDNVLEEEMRRRATKIRDILAPCRIANEWENLIETVLQ